MASAGEKEPLLGEKNAAAAPQYKSDLEAGAGAKRGNLFASPSPAAKAPEPDSEKEDDAKDKKNMLQKMKSGLYSFRLNLWPHPRPSRAGGVVDAMTYDSHRLATFNAFRYLAGTVWHSASLWWNMFMLLILSLFVAMAVLLFIEDPASLKVTKFTEISTFLKVFVGLLLGFFLASSIGRWYACANGFMELFDAVRNLQMQFYALGVKEERISLCMRYGVVSAYLLNMELMSETLSSEDKKAYLKEQWAKLEPPEDFDNGQFTTAYVLPEEKEQLEKVDDAAGLIWIWVCSRIGRMAQDQEIPAMASPTYGRIINLAQDAHGGIRNVRASISVQTPYIYVHTMASLVHINNLVNSMGFGMTLGVTLGTILSHMRSEAVEGVLGEYKHQASPRQVAQDMQDVLVSCFLSVVGPILYQALLEVSLCIAQPFASSKGRIPTERLLKNLEQDLRDGHLMSAELPGWESPVFGAPPGASSKKPALAAPAAPAVAAPPATKAP